MNIFTDEFVNAIEAQLESLTENGKVKAETVCAAIGLSLDYTFAIRFVVDNYLTSFENVRGVGIRRKKVVVK